MPDMIEIIERPASKSSAIIIILIFICLIAAVVWSLLARINSAAIAQGTLVPEGQIVSVRSYEGGIVKSINCELGQYVTAGEVLIELDNDENTIQTELVQNNIAILKEKSIYTSGLINAKDKNAYIKTVPTTSVTEQWKEFTAQYISQRNYMELSKKTLENELMSFLATNESLIDNFSDSQKELYQLELDNLNYSIEMAAEQISTLDAEYNASILTEYQNTQLQLNELRSQYELLETARAHSVISSPINGYICGLTVNSLEQVVGAGENVFSILPADDRLIMECYIQNSSIADVQMGSMAKIKLDAYPFSDYGSINGTVCYINPTVIVHEQLGKVYYAKIELITDEKMPELISGMTGTVEINTGERTVFEYFMSSFINDVNTAFKES